MRYVNSERDEERAARRKAEEKNNASLTSGMIRSIIIAAFISVYAYVSRDIPALFMCISFLVFVMRPFVEKIGGSKGKALSNAMKGFSIALAIGALGMAFF